MSASQQRLKNSIGQAGFSTPASAALCSSAEFIRRLEEKAPEENALEAYRSSQKAFDNAIVAEKSLLLRHSPLLPAAIRLGLRAPDMSLTDYKEWIGLRGEQFAAPGEIASVMSPGAYATALLRAARTLYKDGTQYHIGRRRPDLARLVLNQDNMDTEVSALTLSNDILLSHLHDNLDMKEEAPGTRTDDAALKALSDYLHSAGTPYHHHHTRLREVRHLKDPSFRLMQEAPAVTGRLSGPTLAGIYYDISPALYALLTDEITEDNAEEKFRTYFGYLSPEMVMRPAFLRDWYGLTDEEVYAFLGAFEGDYIDGVLTTRVDNKIYRLSVTKSSGVDNKFAYLHLYPLSGGKWKLAVKFSSVSFTHHLLRIDLFNDFNPDVTIDSRLVGDNKFIPGKEYSTIITTSEIEFLPFQFNIASYLHQSGSGGWSYTHMVQLQQHSPAVFLLKLNKAIRLYKATGLSPRMLEDIVNSINPDQITDETLSVLFRTAMLMEKYGITHEEALVMAKGLISRTAHGSELSQFDRLFNSPSLIEGGFAVSTATLQLNPDKFKDDGVNADKNNQLRATLKRACQTDDAGLHKLFQCFVNNPDTLMTLNITTVSGLYTLSLWARLHDISPHMLHRLLMMLGLPPALYKEPPEAWLALLDKLSATLQWLASVNLTPADLELMVRPVSAIPQSAEVLTLLDNLKRVIQQAGAGFPEKETGESDADWRARQLAERKALLAPFVMNSFRLPGEPGGLTLLDWVDAAAPGNQNINTFWTGMAALTDSEPFKRQQVDFAYTLAQMSLVYHAAGLTPQTLALFIRNPDLLFTDAGEGKVVLPRSLPVIKTLSDFSLWLRTTPEPSISEAAVLSALNDADGVSGNILAQVTGAGQVMATQATAQTSGEAATLKSAQAILTALQWVHLSDAFGVLPDDLGRMLELDYCQGEKRDDWDHWRRVADAFVAGLTPGQARQAEDSINPKMSTALSGYLLAPEHTLQHCKNREGLSRYLLIDNLNGPQVRTSRVAEAISSLQAFIHRTLKSPEDKLSLNAESLTSRFMLEWPQWNSRYSTWSAKNLLTWFPENYLDPTLRLGQTALMDQLLQDLGQAQVNRDTVGDAFLGFLTRFEEVANLETVCGYHDNVAKEAGLTWFLGRNQEEPSTWYWRTVDEGLRDIGNGTKHPQKLPANAWRGWKKINAAFMPWNNCIRPVIYHDRLYVAWVERQQASVEKETGTDSVDRYLLRISGLRYDDSWTSPVSVDVTDSLKGKGNETILSNPGFFVSSWPAADAIRVIFYDSAQKTDAGGTFGGRYFGINIYQDMSTESVASDDVGLKNAMGRLYLSGQLPKAGYNPVIDRFIGPDVMSDSNLVKPGNLPGYPWKAMDLKLSATPTATTAIDGLTYELKLQLTASATRELKYGAKGIWAALISIVPEIETFDYPVRWLDAGERYLVVLDEQKKKFWMVVNKSLAPDVTAAGVLGLKGVRDPLSLSNFNVIPLHGIIQDAGNFWVHEANLNRLFSDYASMGTAFPYYGTVSGEVLTIKWIDDRENIAEKRNTPEEAFRGEPTPYPVIPKASITTTLSGSTVKATATTDFAGGTNLTWSSGFSELKATGLKIADWKGAQEYSHTLTLDIGGAKRTWQLKVYQQPDKGIRVSLGTHGARGAQYLRRSGRNSGDPFPTPPTTISSGTNTRLNTLFARRLTEYAQVGIDTILSYDVQHMAEPPLPGADTEMDFSGANAIYFWELFYYTPMMVMQRFLQEENHELAEKWLNYVWNPAGYIVGGKHTDRIWNVRPLEEDEGWNDDPLESYDPDAVAQNDPMHYRAHVFMRNVDMLIARGDAAYRKLERDTLVEARIWYERALDLLGEMPWVSSAGSWGEPTLGQAASAEAQAAHLDALYWLMQGETGVSSILSAPDKASLFLPEVNSQLIGYWKTLAVRMFNLRNNLTLDGQAMSLPLFAAPADPKALLAAAVAAESGAGGGLPKVDTVPALRFNRLLDGARTLVGQLIQFGSTLQQILERQDGEALSALLTIQGTEMAQGNITLQRQTRQEIAAERLQLNCSMDAAQRRYEHYNNLWTENVNRREMQAMELMSEGHSSLASSSGARMASAGMNMAPNIFGMAGGGVVWGAVAEAAAIGYSIDGDVSMSKSSRISQEEMYRRRREDWDIQRKAAQGEIAVLQAQQQTLDVRERSLEMQLEHSEMQLAHMQAQLALFQSKFSGAAMYSWLRSQLASIYYQFYDLTVSRCLMAQKALQWELNTEQLFIRTGTWNGAWAGLMCGEGLALSLAQMEDVWTKHQQREREITRIVSLDVAFRSAADEKRSLAEAIAVALKGEPLENKVVGIEKNGEQLILSFDLAALTRLPQVRDGFSDDVSRRVRGIAVSLPGLAGPYQNVKASLQAVTGAAALPTGCNACTLSRFEMDNGLFMQGADDGLLAPFEGLALSNTKEGVTPQTMNLNFGDVGQPEQAAFLQSLGDIVLHVQYTLRTGA
ncbi:neuraminidase-like domain-containing protein [Enterobacter chuandaensis]